MLILRTSKPASVEHDGKAAGATPSSLLVRGTAGVLKLTTQDKSLAITLRYRVEGSGVAIRVESRPLAALDHDAVAVGRTPHGPVPAARRHRFGFQLGEGAPAFTVSLLWTPLGG